MWDAVEFWKKKLSGENWENVSILKRLQKRSAFSFCLKYLLKLRPGFILTSSTIFDHDSLVKKKKKARCTAPWMPRDRTRITRQRKQKAYQCVEKIIYIFCGSFYYYDSLAYGVGVMWKISIRACLHGVGDPGLVGLVSFVFTLWNWNPYSAVIKKLYASKKVKEKALAPEGKSCRPENNNYSQSI